MKSRPEGGRLSLLLAMADRPAHLHLLPPPVRPGFGPFNAWANDAYVEGLARCKEQGLCQAVGVSNFNASRIRRWEWHALVHWVGVGR